jgi:YbbR domain-containing protein
VERATEALTEAVSVSGARERVHETVKVGMVDSALRLKTSRSVVVEVEIVPAPVERTVHNVPIHLKNLAVNLTAQSSPSMVDVNVRGSREGLNRVQVDDVSAFVDLSGLGPGPYTLQVRAGAAREAGVTRIEPAVVQVQIANGKD